SYWLHAWSQRRPLRYIGFGGNGFQVRDALHPSDLGLLLAAQMQSPGKDAPSVIHAAGGIENSLSLAELSDWCAGRFGPYMVAREEAERPFDIPWMVMDCGVAEHAWNWRPQRSMTSILEEIARHAEAHPEWLDLSRG
ncbi:MAG TPA: CDP-tyvelose epimerase, partial [Verrucomicrobiales bacterium]|nr:CDP-tyvelose epimerase [Verrucomicrobiales bacterium]